MYFRFFNIISLGKDMALYLNTLEFHYANMRFFYSIDKRHTTSCMSDSDCFHYYCSHSHSYCHRQSQSGYCACSGSKQIFPHAQRLLSQSLKFQSVHLCRFCPATLFAYQPVSLSFISTRNL